MCGRYALVLRPSQVRQLLEDENMPVGDMPGDEGIGTPRQSYNFAPGYHGIVYRADTPDWGAGPRRDGSAGGRDQGTSKAGDATTTVTVDYKLQSMKWGLVPFWTRRNPDYGTIMRTINCRDDSLSTSGGMWATMKARKRCIVIAQGFFEWLKTGPKDKLPYYIKRKDGNLMCFAGLWDCVQFDDSEDKNYTYTVITTDSNKQLKFLHDRMPVILNPGSDELRMWLDPARYEWTRELQSLLKPFSGALDIYPVTKDVGKVGNSSPSFIVPLDSKENKSNIANFFANARQQSEKRDNSLAKMTSQVDIHKSLDFIPDTVSGSQLDPDSQKKRKVDDTEQQGSPAKKTASIQAVQSSGSRKISATRNNAKSPMKANEQGAQKITRFFSKPA